MRKLRELFSDTLVYGISSVLARFVGYLLVPFHTSVFEDTAQYGIITLVYGVIAFLNVIFTAGMESAYIRYGKDRDNAPNVFRTLQMTLTGAATVLVLLLWLAQPVALSWLDLDASIAPIYLMMLGMLWFDTLSVVPFAELRLVRRPVLYAIIRTGHVLINLFLNFYLILGLGFGVEGVFLANLIASAVIAIAVCWVTRSMMSGSWNSYWLKKALSFGWPFIPAGLGYATNEFLDRFFLNAMDPQRVEALYGAGYTPLEIVGIYGGSYKVAVFMLLLIQMFRMAWQPFFMRHSDDPEAPQLFARIFLYFNIAAAALYLTVGLFSLEIVSIRIPFTEGITLIDEAYWMGLQIVPLLLLAYWFHGWYMNFSAGIFISERTGILSVIMIVGAIITIVANAILVPMLGMMGSAWATVISYAVMSLTLFVFSTRAYNVPYTLWHGLLMMILGVAAVNSVSWISGFAGLDIFTVKVLLLAAGFLGLTLLFRHYIKTDRIVDLDSH